MSAVYERTAAHAPRVAGVCVVGVMVSFLVQTALLPAVGLSAAIPFTFATVAVLGVAYGSRTAAIAGFAAGLLLDLGGVGTLGVAALIGALLGAAAGRIRPDRWWFSGVPSAAGLVIVAAAGFAVLNAVLGQVPLAYGQGWIWIAGGGFVSVAGLMPTRTWLQAVTR